MRISKKCEYALRALAEVAIHEQFGRPLARVATLADRTRIPEKFLEQILLTLRNAGILRSKRGVDGGYSLARSANDVTVAEIVRLIDGPIAPIPCAGATDGEPCTCPDPSVCALKPFMETVRDAIVALLEKETIAALAARSRDLDARRDEALQFDI